MSRLGRTQETLVELFGKLQCNCFSRCLSHRFYLFLAAQDGAKTVFYKVAGLPLLKSDRAIKAHFRADVRYAFGLMPYFFLKAAVKEGWLS